MFNNGDKLVAIKDMSFLKEGDIVKVINVNVEVGIVEFGFGNNFEHTGMMSILKFESSFDEFVEDTDEEDEHNFMMARVEEILVNSNITVQTVFDKCTVLSCELPNGFVIIESYSFADPELYDEELGIDICLDKIADRVWEFEKYRLYSESECTCGCGQCEECPCNEEFDEDELDCESCEDYDCPDNPFYDNNHHNTVKH